MSGFKDNFISGSLQKLPKDVAFDGIGGTKYGTHVGQVKYKLFNNNGDLLTLEHNKASYKTLYNLCVVFMSDNT